MVERQRVENARAFVLHTYPYSETSLLVEAYSRAYGRMALVAKGARRPRSNLRGLLLAFQPLAIGWSGRGEVRTLIRAEWQGGQPLLAGDALLCGFYLNELLLRMLPREDPHETLFDRYAEALAGLARGTDFAPVLRGFEKQLLKELGYALALDREAERDTTIDPDGYYRYEPERGPIGIVNGIAAGGPAFSGRTLLAIAADDFSDPRTLAQAKQLMRLLIGHRLDRQTLHSRRIFGDLQQLWKPTERIPAND